jgi:predicted TIM-barrel fold metal-dependent hydrolase
MALSFVDAHHHFQDIESHYYPWLCDKDLEPKLEGDLAPIRRNYLAGDYLKDLELIDLVKSVHVQNGWNPRDPVGETLWLQGLADRHGFPHAIVAYADLAAKDVQSVLEGHLACPNVRGIRQILNWHEDMRFRVAPRSDLMKESAWRRGFELLSRYGLNFDLQIYWPQMADALDLASSFPNTLIILNHFGMPIDRSGDGIKAWAAALQNLAQAENVIVKLSGFGLGHPKWTIADTTAVLLRVVEIFGVERTMFGTNLPVDGLFAEPRKIVEAIENVSTKFNAEEQEKLLRENALAAYRI